MKDRMQHILPLPLWFTRAIESLQASDLDTWMNIYAADAVHEFPFAPQGAPTRLVGTDAIAAYLRGLPGLVHFDRSLM